jgi:hypothetical protein
MLLRQRVRGLSLPCNDDLLSLPVWIKVFEMDEEWCISKISNKLIRTNFMIPLSLRASLTGSRGNLKNKIGFANTVRKPKGLENEIASSLRSSQ